MANVQYSTWAELFKIHARSHRVLDHIIPPAKGKEKVPSTDEEKELWSTLDAIVLSWIYSTILNDLLQTIIEPDSTAMDAWNRLRDIFQDNQNSRAVALEQEFSTTTMEDYPSVSEYCQRIKSLADQLKNVGAPVSDSRMVLRLVSGLSKKYSSVGMLIRQSDPLPPFYKARSMLTLEEAGLAKETTPDSVLLASSTDDSPNFSNNNSGGKNKGKSSGRRQNSGNSGGRRNTGGSSGKGGRQQTSGGRNPGQQQQQSGTLPSYWQQPAGPYPWGWNGWPIPPCPYPTQGWARPSSQQNRTNFILGPRPQQHSQQAYSAGTTHGQPPYTPTDIEAAMHTMTLKQPDPAWYMDTGATSHMTSSSGNFSSYFNLSNHPRNSIVVGSGQTISIHGYGHTNLPSPNPPLSLKNVLHAPKLIKNLISVRKFTSDNSVSVEFVLLGFL
ncbi:uncharacterized protein LOC110700735 [Chenopodium quinoa]|uniref:uncharacterized protein LOC110700735 n=1 Tax=Chenopodium quinoa TaxID=63459 RepID=UPI000B78FC4E|nr:uncharacterized protein LOC110700735 [Chenopodium quinoa]